MTLQNNNLVWNSGLQVLRNKIIRSFLHLPEPVSRFLIVLELLHVSRSILMMKESIFQAIV